MSGWSDQRRAVAAAAVAFALVLAVGLHFLMKRGDREIGSNAVGVGAPVATVQPGDKFCINSTFMPDGARRVELWVGAPKPATFSLYLVANDGAIAVRHGLAARGAGFAKYDMPALTWPASRTGRVCVVPADGMIQFGGAFLPRLPGERPMTLNGRRLDPKPDSNEAAIHYFTAATDRPRNLQKVPGLFAHSRPFHGPLFPWVMLLTLVAAIAAAVWAVWLVATAEARSKRVLAWAFFAVALAWGAAWAVMAPPMQGNDEPEHYAQLVHIAETGRTADPSVGSKLPSYSAYEDLFMKSVHHNAVVVDASARPLWSAGAAHRRQAALAAEPRDNGGGSTISASGHSGLYYSLLALPYRLTTWMQPANQLVVMRILSDVLGAAIAALVVLTALALFEGRKMPAAAAGALVAGQPMVNYVHSGINNDVAVNLLGAVALWLLVTLAGAGWRLRREIALGVNAVAAPLAKITGLSVAVFTAAGVTMAIARDRTLRSLRGGATVLGAVIASSAFWLLFTSAVGWRATLVNVHADEPPPPPQWIPSIPQRIDYIWQTFVPWIHLTGGPMTQQSVPAVRLYIAEAFGDFFWHRISYPPKWYAPIAAAVALMIAGGVLALWRHRRWVRERWLQVALVLLMPAVVAAFVGWAYATPGGRAVLGEQGRYIFPAIAALCVAGAGGGFGMPRKLRPVYWGGLSALMLGYGVFAYFFAAFHAYA